MDGNQSLLVAEVQLSQCADGQAPFIINIVLGLPANMCVMWLILAGSGDKAAEIFSLNQAICEVAICVSNVLLLIAKNTMISSAANVTYLWYMIRFCLGFMFSGRFLFMSAVCLERYLAVVHPVTFLKCKLLTYRLALTGLSWLTVLVCCVICMWVPSSAIFYVCFSMSFTWFPVQLFFCVETLRALRRPRPGERNEKSNGMNSAKLKAFRIIMIILVSESLTFLPYIIAIISLGHLSEEDSSELFCITTYVALVSGFIPSLLYIHRAGKHCFKDTG